MFNVVSQITTLYSTNDTHTVKRIQEELQPLQRTPEARALANALLHEPNPSCQYFGALTYAVYINTQQVPSDLPQELLGHILRIPPSGLFIVRKLLGCLSSMYLQELMDDPVAMIATQPSETTVGLTLLLLTTIAEDLANPSRAGKRSSKDIHEQIFPHLARLVETLDSEPSVRSGLMDAINAWVVYISNTEAISSERYTEGGTEGMMRWLLRQFHVENLEEDMPILNKAFTTLSDVVELNTGMSGPFKNEIRATLFEHFGIQFIMAIIFDEDRFAEYSSEAENFVNLLCIFVTHNMIYISRHILDPGVQAMVSVMLELTNHPQRPIVDERVSEQMLALWEELVNVYHDDQDVLRELYKEDYARIVEHRDEVLGKVGQIYWRKGQYVQPQMPSEFVHYRHQIAELFIALYSLLGESFYQMLTTSVIESLQKPDMQSLVGLESSLHLLAKITDDLSFYDDTSNSTLVPLVGSLFHHKLVETVEQTLGVSASPDTRTLEQVNITLLQFLSSLQFFFKSETGTAYLGVTFNYLFSIILGRYKLALPNSSVSLVASKTALKICQGSKDNLTGFLPTLESILYEMISNVAVDNLIRERMTNSYISIAMTLKDPTQYGAAVSSVLSKISEELAKSNQVSPDQTEDYATSLLACVNEVGKAAQIPDEVDDFFTPEQAHVVDEYWRTDTLQVKPRILDMLNEFSVSHPVLAQNAIVTELCCSILRSGLGEPINGPFSFEPDVIVSYMVSKVPHCTPTSVGYVYSLASSLVVTSGKRFGSDAMADLLDRLFVHLQPSFGNDIEWTKSCLDLFTTILDKYPGLLVGLPVVENAIVPFALAAFEHNEVFVIKSTVKFWTSLVTLKKGSRDEQLYTQELMDRLCSQLTRSLMSAFLKSPRSNLDRFYHLFRNLVAKFPALFKTALLGSLPQSREVSRFVESLMLTRGQRQAHDVLKRFWLEYNGLQEYGRG